MARYEITHNEDTVRTIVSENQDVVRNMMNLILKLSDENAGVFTSWRVELDSETGRRNYTRIASAKNGTKI